MPGSPDHWWYSRGDRERIAAIEADLAKYRRLVDDATNERDQRRYAQLVGAHERQLRTFRTYPFSIWLGGMLISVALLPWALLTRAGDPALGVAAGGVVVMIEAVVVVVQRRRRRVRGQDKTT